MLYELFLLHFNFFQDIEQPLKLLKSVRFFHECERLLNLNAVHQSSCCEICRWLLCTLRVCDCEIDTHVCAKAHVCGPTWEKFRNDPFRSGVRGVHVLIGVSAVQLTQLSFVCFLCLIVATNEDSKCNVIFWTRLLCTLRQWCACPTTCSKCFSRQINNIDIKVWCWFPVFLRCY